MQICTGIFLLSRDGTKRLPVNTTAACRNNRTSTITVFVVGGSIPQDDDILPRTFGAAMR